MNLKNSNRRIWFALFPRTVCILKAFFPALVARLVMFFGDMRSARDAIRIGVALIPLQQWLSVLVLALVVRNIRGVTESGQRRALFLPMMLLWVPLVIATLIVLHEWLVQYPALIRVIGIGGPSGTELLAPLSKP